MSLLRATATVSALTLLSRVLGLLRENLTASIFGANAFTDAFFVAFRLPNLLRRLFAEGAFSQAFVPILSEARLRGEESGDPGTTRLLADRVATALFWTVTAVSLLGVAASPVLVYLMASGLGREPAAFDAAVTMTRWMFPYIIFVSLVALSAGVLNTWRRFAVPAFTPALLNLCFIAAALLLARYFDPPVLALSAGVLLGGAAQLAIQLPALKKIGMLPRISLRLGEALRDPYTRRIIKLMAPAALAVSVAQLSLIINTHIASRLAAGSVSWISYGDRLMEFPTALLGVALGTVLLPSLSRAAAAEQASDYSRLIDWGLRLTVVFAVPCMVGLALMAEPLTALLFHYGRFDARDVAMTSAAVTGYSAGLLGLISVKVLAPAFYARQDVRTPVRIGIAVLIATQLMNLVFVPWLAHAGLAWSISVGASVNAALLLAGLIRRGSYQPRPGWLRFGAQVAAAATLMAALLWFAVPAFDWIGLRAAPLTRIGLTLGLVATAGLLYLVSLLALGVRPRHFLRANA